MTNLRQAFGNDNPKVPQGLDGSEILAKNKGYSISIGIPRGKGKLLKFKSFVTDFSRTAESSYQEEGFGVADSPRAIKGPVKNDIMISFDLPSVSLNEGRVNLRKVQELCRFFMSDRSNLHKFTHNPEHFVVYVSFSNFIVKEGPGIIDPETYKEIKDDGQKCIFKNFSFEIDVSAGFYEGGIGDSRDIGKLIPKKMSVTMDLTPILNDIKNKPHQSSADVFPRFEGKGDRSIGYPFGIDLKLN